VLVLVLSRCSLAVQLAATDGMQNVLGAGMFTSAPVCALPPLVFSDRAMMLRFCSAQVAGLEGSESCIHSNEAELCTPSDQLQQPCSFSSGCSRFDTILLPSAPCAFGPCRTEFKASQASPRSRASFRRSAFRAERTPQVGLPRHGQQFVQRARVDLGGLAFICFWCLRSEAKASTKASTA
jgi:hypothetical protein